MSGEDGDRPVGGVGDAPAESARDQSPDATDDDAPTESARARARERAIAAEAKTGRSRRRAAPTLWHRAFARWTAVSAVMATLFVIYTQHPYYRAANFTPFRTLFPTVFVLWLTLGLFYCKATLERFHQRRYVMRDGALHLLLLATVLFGRGRGDQVLGPERRRLFWRRAKSPRVRTTLLGILVKAFFAPLMLGFLSGHSNGIADAWLRHKQLPPLAFKLPPGTLGEQASAWWANTAGRLPDLVPSAHDFRGLFSPGSWTRDSLSWAFGITYDIVFFVDCGVAMLGYSLESRWLDNKTRSVEPTALGWAVCLACYPPYNNALGTYLPLERAPAIITNPDVLLALRGLTVFLFAIYATATAAFGLKFSNLTHRGIISRGPYRFVRHPAYLTKCLAWWLEHLPTLSVRKAFFLTLLCGVYALRAWTEERHLGRDPAYRAYRAKVPWVVFPGIY